MSTRLSDWLHADPEDEGLASLVFGVVCHVLAFALGIVWAFAIVVVYAATDGVPPDEYSGPNRAGFAMLLTALLMTLPVGTWMAYVLIRLVVGRRLLSLLLAQLPPVVIGAALGAWW